MDALSETPLNIGDAVEVILPEESSAPDCRSRVLQAVGGKLLLEWPARRGERAVLLPRQLVYLLVIRDDVVHQLGCAVTELLPEPAPRILVQPFAATRRIQQREHFRVRSLIPLRLAALPGSSGPKLHIVTHTAELSGSGFEIHHGTPMADGAEFQVRMALEAHRPPMKFLARVVHSDPLEGFGEFPLYRIALAFSSISESQRAAIVRHVFGVQRGVRT